jgi:peptide-methionine (S)-S-oxide reductase
MNVRRIAPATLAVSVLLGPGAAFGQDAKPGTEPAGGRAAAVAQDTKDKAPPADDGARGTKPKGPQVATFGGGCFWCTEAVCELVPGVLSAVSGYSGGRVPFPTYQAVSSGLTGHAEVVQVVFNPAVISYEKLLEIFFRSHDPTTPNAQGPDVGTQYRSIILYHNEEQKRAAQRVYQDLKKRRVLKGTVVTELVPFVAFFPAEAYHQDYYRNHPFDPYSMVHIEPKFDVFWKMKMVPPSKSRKRTPHAPRATPPAAARPRSDQDNAAPSATASTP